MLKRIQKADCAPALEACQSLMKKFSLWLCESTISAADITLLNLGPPTLNSDIEANWLWAFIHKEAKGVQLVEHAKIVANMNNQHKLALRAWVNSVTNLNSQFQVPPMILPVAPLNIGERNWNAYKELMLLFYSKGLHQAGLPYMPDGLPTADSSEYLTYQDFKDDFLSKNKLVARDDTPNICVLCGDSMNQIDVDHWIYEAAYPILSICANNLLPICSPCNKRPNKGTKNVHTQGDFSDWFHPYLRAGNGTFTLSYSILPKSSVTLTSLDPQDANRITNLDELLDLTRRWTTKFKSEYRDKQDELRRLKDLRARQGRPTLSQQEVQERLEDERDTMVPHKAHYELKQLICNTILEQARLDAWRDELGLS